MGQNLIEKAFESYRKHQAARGFDTDEVSFVGGFLSAYGIMTGRVPVGLPEDTSILKVFELLQKELDEYRNKVLVGQAEAKYHPSQAG